MRKYLPVCAALLIAGSTGIQARDAAATKMADSKMSGKKVASDIRFAKEAAAGGIAEVKLGQLAVDKGSSDFVKQFGQKMVDDHSKANDKMKDVAQKNDIALPTDITPKDQILYDNLSKLSGEQFDSVYVSAMIKDHQKDIAEFQKEANGGKNPDIKGFASETLPTIQHHLEMLQAKTAS